MERLCTTLSILFIIHDSFLVLSPCFPPLSVVCVSVGRMAWLSVPSSTDTDLTSSITPNCARCHNPLSVTLVMHLCLVFCTLAMSIHLLFQTHLFSHTISVIFDPFVTNVVSWAVNALLIASKKRS